MEQILLTPIETLNVVKGIDKAWRGYTDDYAIHEGIAKAQLKKVVDYLNTFEFFEDWGGECGKRTRDTIVEALQKEIE